VVAWDAAAAIAALPISPFGASAWRAHHLRYAATDATGSQLVSGRYNRGVDLFSRAQAWPALYCGLGRDVCIGEIVRHADASILPLLNDYMLSELHVSLSSVLDCRDSAALGLDDAALLHDYDLSTPQRLAGAARAGGVEGIIVPSATLLGNALIVFPDLLLEGSTLRVRESQPMRLYVERTGDR
jgi:RES domain-containing protein